MAVSSSSEQILVLLELSRVAIADQLVHVLKSFRGAQQQQLLLLLQALAAEGRLDHVIAHFDRKLDVKDEMDRYLQDLLKMHHYITHHDVDAELSTAMIQLYGAFGDRLDRQLVTRVFQTIGFSASCATFCFVCAKLPFKYQQGLLTLFADDPPELGTWMEWLAKVNRGSADANSGTAGDTGELLLNGVALLCVHLLPVRNEFAVPDTQVKYLEAPEEALTVHERSRLTVMSPKAVGTSMKAPSDLLGSDNWFHWEFNMRMTLAKKGLLEHIVVEKTGGDEEWKVKDMKAFAIIAQGVQLEHQTKIRRANTAKQAWVTLSEFYNRANLQNRVAMTRRLHEFKMELGSTVAAHLDRFDELVVSMEAVGEPMDEGRQLVILLGSMPSEFDILVSIIENTLNPTLIDVKEKLLKEDEKHKVKVSSETAFKARATGSRHKNTKKASFGKQRPKTGTFGGKCYACGKLGHKAVSCNQRMKSESDELTFMASNVKSDGWLLDSGASSHMTPFKDDFTMYETLENAVAITIADGATMSAVGTGDIVIALKNGKQATVKNVLFIPGLDRRLLSIAKITANGMNVEFGIDSCVIKKNGVVVMSVPKCGNVYKLHCSSPAALMVEHSERQSEWELWHARLGHPSFERVRKSQPVTVGLPTLTKGTGGICGGCAKGKMTVASFPKQPSHVKTSSVLELIHSDVMGPMKTQSSGGSRYILLFVDDFSRHVTGYFLKKKSEVSTKFQEFKALLENQTGNRIKKVRTDNGSEFVNKAFDAVCAASGIVHQLTTPYSPQQNGLVERMNRSVIEMARSMLHYKRVDYKWWAEAANTAIYLTNRMTNAAHPHSTPYEVCYGKPPRMDHLRVFGSIGYAHIEKENRTKLDAKSYKCMHLGYSDQAKAYRVLDISTNKVKMSRSLIVDEREVDGIYSDIEPRDVSEVVFWRDEYDNDRDTMLVDSVGGNCNPDVEMRDAGACEEHEGTEAEQLQVRETYDDIQHPRADGDVRMSDGEQTNELVVRELPSTSSNAMVFHPTLNSRLRSRFQTSPRVSGSIADSIGQANPMLTVNSDQTSSPAPDSIVLFNQPSGRLDDDSNGVMGQGCHYMQGGSFCIFAKFPSSLPLKRKPLRSPSNDQVKSLHRPLVQRARTFQDPCPITVELTNERFPHLSSHEWAALERMRAVIGEAAVISLLRSASPDEQRNVATSFMHHEIMNSHRQPATPVTTMRVAPLKLDVSPYRGGENEPLARWFVELDAAITARQLRDPMQQVLFAMSNLAGRAKSWAYGKRLAEPHCFYDLDDFKRELKKAFEPPQSEFRARAEFLKLRQGKYDLHSYAQRARYLVSSIVNEPIDASTQVVTFMAGLNDDPIRNQLFREYPKTLDEAIERAMQEEFSIKQAKFNGFGPRPVRQL
ncbi:Integrase catalytic core protein, partial [Globisporangium splendens]